jgi:uncharacterized protein YcbX
MTKIGTVVSVWRYPVKGMRGEELDEAFASFSGLYGDRLYAFRSTKAPAGFPYHTAREQEDLLLYQPKFRSPQSSKRPPNLVEADAMPPGATPVFADKDALALDVVAPDGETLPIDSDKVLQEVRESRDDGAEISLVYSERALTDCRPVSLFNVATAQKLGEEIGTDLDIRRFRANLNIELEPSEPFAENELIGRSMKIGSKAVISIIDIDPRCKMIGLDPETGDNDPRVLQHLSTVHGGKAGLYAAVLVEGLIHPGDEILLQ